MSYVKYVRLVLDECIVTLLLYFFCCSHNLCKFLLDWKYVEFKWCRQS